jgi:hypothetical protein
MNTKVIVSAVFVLVMSLSVIGYAVERHASVFSSPVISGSLMNDDQDYPVRGEIRETYQLSPNANIEVTGIGGSVEVETTDDNTAKIHFVRYGRTQADYDCETIVIQHSPSKLVVQHQTKTEKQCRVIQAREEMKLVVPRSANLSFSKIEGNFTTGKTDGFLQLKNIEGFVRAADVQAAEIASVERSVSLNITGLNSQGISVRGVEGTVELGLADNLDANLRVAGVIENVEINHPNIQTSEFRRTGFRLQLGKGGTGILISGIEGSMRIRRV